MANRPWDMDSVDQAFDAIGAKAEWLPPWRLALSGIPDFITAAACWIAWSEPWRFGPPLVKQMELVVVMEFVVIHASGFLGFLGRNRWLGGGLVAFYFLFAWAIAAGTHSMWVLAGLAWLLFSKLHLRLPGTSAASQQSAIQEQLIDWPFSVAAYLGSLGAGLAWLEVPRLGITDEVFEAAGLKGAGLFEDQPWKALAAGVIYFSLMGLWRMRIWRWVLRRP